MEKISKYLIKVLKFVASLIIGTILTIFLSPILNDKWAMLQAYWRVLQDEFNSGFIHGTPFKNDLGQWVVAWRLGGPPFIHVVIPYVFAIISMFGGISCCIYLVRKYRSYRRLREICTYLVHPRNFRGYIAVSIVVATFMLFLVGFAGTRINPETIVPAKPSNDFLGFNVNTSFELIVSIGRHALVEINPSVLDENNMTGWFCCVIKTPENAFWEVSDMDISTIVLNGTIRPYSASVFDSDTTAYVQAKFDKNSLTFVFENHDSLKLGTATLSISGRLKNEDSFEGSTLVKIVQGLQIG